MELDIIQEQLLTITIYFFSSVSTTLANKQILNAYLFPYHYLLIIIQSAIISILILVWSIFFTRIHYRNISKWFLTSIFLSLMMISNMKAVYYFQVSLFTLYKNCSIILVAVLELYIFSKKISILGYFSFILMILSSYTANIKDHIEPIGYFWMALNIISTAAYVLYLKFVMIHRGSKLESVFFTNLISIPILSIFSAIFDNYKLEFVLTPSCAYWIFFSSVCALITSFSTAWTLKVLSSTALCMLGAMNKLLLSVSGIIWFRENLHLMKIGSLLVGITAGAVYSYDSIKTVPIENN